MPAFMEKKLKAEYPHNNHAVYGTMNKLGLMRGSKTTAKGRDAEARHHRDMKKKTSIGHLMLEMK